ncbi:MAG: hypothetical protein KME45_03125 [Stenomitos rutilans HA7619-LM2]|nr:hypothetical protein [Stenomitos rutilans HA7619-LM2]MBW4469377.1 hypothetical protein [Stenomitos rutilans HA7619-LM2]
MSKSAPTSLELDRQPPAIQPGIVYLTDRAVTAQTPSFRFVGRIMSPSGVRHPLDMVCSLTSLTCRQRVIREELGDGWQVLEVQLTRDKF